MMQQDVVAEFYSPRLAPFSFCPTGNCLVTFSAKRRTHMPSCLYPSFLHGLDTLMPDQASKPCTQRPVGLLTLRPLDV